MEKHVLDLIIGMKSLSHRVFVWCPEGPMADLYRKAGAKVIKREIRFDIDPIYILSLSAFLKKNKINVVHGHELKAATNGVLAGFLAGVKFKFSHTHTPISHWQIGRFMKNLTIFGYKCLVNLFSTKEIALTQSIKEAKILEGIHENKLVVIPNGIDFNRFQITPKEKEKYRKEIYEKYKIPKGSFVLGNISRLTEEKGYNLLIEAFSMLLARRVSKNKVFLLIVGGGSKQSHYESLIVKYKVAGRAIITGIFEESEKVKLQSALDLLVFPSLAEGFGYVVVEAMAYGLPVLASDLPVLKDVGGDTIHYFKTGDTKALFERIVEMTENWEESSKLTSMARKRVKSMFTIKQFNKNYHNLSTKLKI